MLNCLKISDNESRDYAFYTAAKSRFLTSLLTHGSITKAAICDVRNPKDRVAHDVAYLCLDYFSVTKKNEPRHEKTVFLHMRKQRHRSAVQ